MAFTESFGAKIAEIPGVRHVMQIIGIDVLSSTRQPNGVLIPVKLNDIGDREGKNGQSVQEIINKVAAMGADAPEATVRAFNMAVLPGMSNTGNLSLYIMDTVTVPATFRGLPITLLYIGILALAIYGFTGHMLAF